MTTVGPRASRWRIMAGLGLVCALVALLEISGASPLQILRAMTLGAWGSKTGAYEAVVKAVPICLCALAAALPARFGLINLGGEGQLLAGAIGATGVALLGAAWPSPLLLSLMGLSALTAGAAWGFLPGFLKAVTKTSETVSSLLLNYVAALALLYLIHGRWRDPGSFGWPQSPAFPDAARLPLWPGTRVHLGVAFAAALAVLLFLAFQLGPLGRSARVVMASEQTARIIGLRPRRNYMGAFLVAGAIAGLAGLCEVAAVQGRLREGISLGYGFAGFLVAWLCRQRFEWIPLAALAMGGILSAGDALQVSAGLPFAVVDLVQGLLLLGVVIHEALVRQTTAIRVVAGER
jgi:simple sugar transport system permease protein